MFDSHKTGCNKVWYVDIVECLSASSPLALPTCCRMLGILIVFLHIRILPLPCFLLVCARVVGLHSFGRNGRGQWKAIVRTMMEHGIPAGGSQKLWINFYNKLMISDDKCN
jgi:hypothetical protein